MAEKRTLDPQDGKDTERLEGIEIDKRPVSNVWMGHVSEEEQVTFRQSCACQQLQEHTTELSGHSY